MVINQFKYLSLDEMLSKLRNESQKSHTSISHSKIQTENTINHKSSFVSNESLKRIPVKASKFKLPLSSRRVSNTVNLSNIVTVNNSPKKSISNEVSQ